MPLNLTEEQIIQLAPDAASVKAGKGLAVPGKWVLLACSERAVWGHCQGSGKNPYQTAIDLNDIAFKCSCPSRKFPCKHGLGLLLLFAAKPELFEQAEEPDWVATWLSKRGVKAEKKEQKARDEKPVDAAAQAKRQEKRHQNVLNGIEDLETWMKDLVRNGLVNVPERADSLFEDMARRMVDAQAQGLAGRLRAIEEISFLGDEWKYELTDRLGKLYLLAESYRNLRRDTHPGGLSPIEGRCSGRGTVGRPMDDIAQKKKSHQRPDDRHLLAVRETKRKVCHSAPVPDTRSGDRNESDSRLCIHR